MTYLGVLLFMTVIITYRFIGLPVGDIAVVMALLGVLIDRKGIVFPNFLLLLLAFLAWCWLGTLTSRYPQPSADASLQLTKLALIWWTALAAIRTRAQFRWAMIVLVFLYATHPIRGGIMNILVYKHSLMGRTVWNQIFANPNDYAVLTILFLSIAVGLAMTEKKGIVKLGAMASCVVFPIMILYTQSRANFLALGFFTLAIFAGQTKKARSALMLGVVLVAALITVPSDAWERLGGVTSLGSTESARELDASANERLEIWRVASMIAVDKMATGTGWGTYQYAHHEYSINNKDLFPYFIGRDTFRDAHSTYFTVVAEVGLPGTALWLGAILTVVFFANKQRRRYGEIMPKAARQLAVLEYGLGAYGIAAIWGSYASHSFLYLHLTWIWVAASLLQKDGEAFERLQASGRLGGATAPAPQRSGAGFAPPAVARPPQMRPRFDPSLVGFPAKREAPPAS